MSNNKHYFKGLNGLRAIAAIAVLIFHTNHSMQLFGFKKGPDLNLAGFGVTIFFALSGFLITYLLLKEKDKGHISLKKFYLRRIFRIWPLYYTVLILSVVCAYTLIDTDISRLWFLFYYVFFFANIPFIMNYGIPGLGHLWSIGIEEQFYIFWPIFIIKSNKILKHIILFIVIMNIIRLIFRFIEVKYNYHTPYLVIQVMRFDCFAIGGIGAILFKEKNEQLQKIANHFITQIICWGCIVLMMFNKFHTFSIFDQSIVSVITVFLIINVSGNQKKIINLDNVFFDFLGTMSYGIYMWHPLIIFILSKMNSFLTLAMPSVYVLVVIITIAVATLSYKIIEKPFLKIKERYS